MTASSPGSIAALWRHPVKGFTPEPLEGARLQPGQCFPGDRLYAVEDGPSGFDPAAPRHISKMRFAVLAKIPKVALARTRYDESTGELSVQADGMDPFRALLTTPIGRRAFADWLGGFLADEARGPLQVIEAPGDHRFMDDRQGFVSVINMASLRDLETRVGRPLDARRFRANVYVEGWPAWIENERIGQSLNLGPVAAHIIKPTGRCRAIHVDPERGVDDIDLVSQIYNHFGHTIMGVYVRVERGGRIAIGDAAELAA